MSKFTSGKWQVNADMYANLYVDVYDPDDFLRRTVCTVNDESYKGRLDEEARANARLIAAAPEMYELLKEELIPNSDYGGIVSFSREAKVRELLARIDTEEDAE